MPCPIRGVQALRIAIAGLVVWTMAAGGCGGEEETPPPSEPHPASADRPEPPEAPGRSVALGPELSGIFRLIGERRMEAARERLEEYLDESPRDGRATFLVGLSYHRQKHYAQARPHFERAITLEPEYHPAYHFLGWCMYYLGEMDAARRAFEMHLGYLPDEGDSHFAIGLIDLDEHRLAEAEERFLRAIELQADIPRRQRDVAKAHARLADVYLLRNELEPARGRLQRATELWPEHYAAFYKLHRVLTRLGDEEAAREAFRLYKLYQERAHPKRGVPERAR